MTKGKKVRTKGKIPLSKYFKKYEDGDTVAVVKELGVRAAFPMRIVGKTGKVVGSRGAYKVLELKDGDKLKTFVIHPVHLKAIK